MPEATRQERRIVNDEICMAYRVGYGLFPVASIDFNQGVVYDYEGKAHRLGALCRLMIRKNIGVNTTVERTD